MKESSFLNEQSNASFFDNSEEFSIVTHSGEIKQTRKNKRKLSNPEEVIEENPFANDSEKEFPVYEEPKQSPKLKKKSKNEKTCHYDGKSLSKGISEGSETREENPPPMISERVVAAWADEDDEDNARNLTKAPKVFEVNREESSDEDDDVIINKKIMRLKNSSYLPLDSKLRYMYLGAGNRERTARGRITSSEFNPRYEIFMSASYDTSLAFFKLDKNRSTFFKDRVFESFPIECAKFTTDGNKVILTSMKSATFRLYDINTSNETRASQFLVNTPSRVELGKIAVSPMGNNCAILASTGHIHITDVRSMEKVSTLFAPGKVSDLSYNANADTLYVTTRNGDVLVYDFRNSNKGSIKHRWSDFGFATRSFSISKDNKFIACGTDSGHVNLYMASDTLSKTNPEPIKSLDNLQTGIDLTLFHPRNEILAYASSNSNASLRLYHVHGGMTFQNLSDSLQDMRKPTSLAFSPNGKYLSVGQVSGVVSLFCIKHYRKY